MLGPTAAASDVTEKGVATTAALWGHELRFVRGQRRRTTWVVCRRCRFSCYMSLASPESADAALEKWMLVNCGGLSAQPVEEYGYQLLSMNDGTLRVVFMKCTLDPETAEAVRADAGILGERLGGAVSFAAAKREAE